MRLRVLLLAPALLAAPAGAQGVADQLADLRLETAVRLALAGDPATAAADARVSARAGTVSVDADWPSAEAEARAAALAGGVSGVASVAMGSDAPVPAEELGAGAAAEPDEAPPPAEEPAVEEPPADEPAPAYEPAIEPVTPEAPATVEAEAPPAPNPGPPAPAPAAAYGHTVRIGDTLYSIARRYGTTVEELQRLNDLGDSTEITLGRRLRVR